MHSSSTLFPVALLSAERRGDLTEDVYRIKAGNSPDPSVALAVTRLGRIDGGASPGCPVILLHGLFSNRRFWYSAKGIGLGATLARAGYDVWIPEMRGHGLSPRNLAWSDNRVADYALYDLPAIAAFVRERSGSAPHWIAHSLGGTSLVAALASGALAAEQAASVALFGTQISRASWMLKVPPLVWLARLILRRFTHASGRRLKRGPEDEPLGLVREYLRWQGLFGGFGKPDGDWWAALASVEVPVLGVAAVDDPNDPAWACQRLIAQWGGSQRQFLELGPATGFARFGHTDMLVSREAQTQVWPLVARWLEQPGAPLTPATEVL